TDRDAPPKPVGRRSYAHRVRAHRGGGVVERRLPRPRRRDPAANRQRGPGRHARPIDVVVRLAGAGQRAGRSGSNGRRPPRTHANHDPGKPRPAHRRGVRRDRRRGGRGGVWDLLQCAHGRTPSGPHPGRRPRVAARHLWSGAQGLQVERRTPDSQSRSPGRQPRRAGTRADRGASAPAMKRRASSSRSAAKPASGENELIAVAGREVTLSNPDKILFPKPKYTKRDLVQYYLAVAEGALRGAGDRPNVLVRYPNGMKGEFFYQKRAPDSRPPWVEVVALSFPSGRTAEEVVPRDAATLAWMANLACLELHPHPVRAHDLDHPDELRIDLDPVPGVPWSQLREVAHVVRATLEDLGLVGWPKTSGSRGMHVYVRIHRQWTFDQVRRAALAFAREVERRAPALATSKWWKEERHGVFL